VARGFRKGIEEFLETFGLAEFAGENGVDGHLNKLAANCIGPSTTASSQV
jgi:hypothetical protein